MSAVRISLSDWRPSSARRPHVRVAVVLPSDDMHELEFTLPDAPFAIRAAPGLSRNVRGGTALRITAERNGASLAIGGAGVGCGGRWTIEPLSDHCGDVGVVVHNVRAGRGFHWEQQTTPVLSGRLELSNVDGRLLLVDELDVETYLGAVIASEMSGRCPAEFLRAQCIAARSWLLAQTERKHDDWGVDVCNDDCCQRYHGTGGVSDAVRAAVASTTGRVLTTGAAEVVDANYAKCCGGITEAPVNVWGTAKPGLASVVDAPATSPASRFMPVSDGNVREFLDGAWLQAGDVFCGPDAVPAEQLPSFLGAVDDGASHFRWRVEYSRGELEDLLRRKLPAHEKRFRHQPLARLTGVTVVRRGVSGRALELRVTYRDVTGAQRRVTVTGQHTIRDVLHDKFLYSSLVLIELQRDARGMLECITLIGGGWGHGAGLCQIGALGMAVRGYGHEDILKHYYREATVRCVYA